MVSGGIPALEYQGLLISISIRFQILSEWLLGFNINMLLPSLQNLKSRVWLNKGICDVIAGSSCLNQ